MTKGPLTGFLSFCLFETIVEVHLGPAQELDPTGSQIVGVPRQCEAKFLRARRINLILQPIDSTRQPQAKVSRLYLIELTYRLEVLFFLDHGSRRLEIDLPRTTGLGKSGLPDFLHGAELTTTQCKRLLEKCRFPLPGSRDSHLVSILSHRTPCDMDALAAENL